MAVGLRSSLFITLIAAIALCCCGYATILLAGALSPDDPGTETMPVDDTVMGGGDASEPDMESVPVKLVWLIDYPVGGKEEYLAWVVSISHIIRAPEELGRLAAYDNLSGSNPKRMVEFEFSSFADASTYLNRPGIAAVMADLPNRSSSASAHIFVQRSDYEKNQNASRAVKTVYLIDYPMGGKAAYLEWDASVVPGLQTPDEVKRIASYDNYYGVSSHRLVEFEFDSLAEANAYEELTAIRDINAELPNRAGRAAVHTFELHSVFVNE